MALERNPTTFPPAVLVTGASGRVGGLLRAALPKGRLGGMPVIWHARRGGPGLDLAWDIGREPPPDLPRGLVIVHLAGQTAGSAEALAGNAVSAAAVAEMAARIGGHVLLMSTAAVYAPGAHDLTAREPPAPVSDYGRAKLAAEVAAQAVLGPDRLTVLRLANLAGADALFGNALRGGPVVLDPIAGQPGGPLRSYIGPGVLARVLGQMVGRVTSLPPVMNLAQPGAVAMADILQALGADWHFGPPRAGAVARVVLDVGPLQSLFSLPEATAKGLVGDLARVTGGQA